MSPPHGLWCATEVRMPPSVKHARVSAMHGTHRAALLVRGRNRGWQHL